MIGPECQFDSPDEATFCIKCGQRLRESKPLAYVAGAWKHSRPAMPKDGSGFIRKPWPSSDKAGPHWPEVAG